MQAQDDYEEPLGPPEVVCLCGSSRFLAEMSIMKWEIEKGGRIALSMSLLPNTYPGVVPDHQAEEEGVKEAMDELHLRKIDLADRVLVMDIDGYIGASTRRRDRVRHGHRQADRLLHSTNVDGKGEVRI